MRMGDSARRNSDENSCILWQNDEETVTLLDIPRSIELAQRFEGTVQGKLWSSRPLQKPYPPIEPKSLKALAALEIPSIDNLILQRILTLAVQEVKKSKEGNEDGELTWCLPRLCYNERKYNSKDGRDVKKRNLNAITTSATNKGLDLVNTPRCQRDSYQEDNCGSLAFSPYRFFINTSGVTTTTSVPGCNGLFILPESSTYICGSIASTLPIFIQHAPRFPLIILDPPWPNRSARRAGHYQTSYGNAEVKELLSSIPIRSKLDKSGLVAVWVTNKPAFRSLLIGEDGEGGLFEEWGVQLVEEWVWLKITDSGEPISSLEGAWRKPYEILLVGRNLAEVNEQTDLYGTGYQKGHDDGTLDKRKQDVKTEKLQTQSRIGPTHIKRRVILAVPDLHSRKPNLTSLFAPLLPYSQPFCLEIFARNLTAHGWAWGDETLKFQSLEHWTNYVCDGQQNDIVKE